MQDSGPLMEMDQTSGLQLYSLRFTFLQVLDASQLQQS